MGGGNLLPVHPDVQGRLFPNFSNSIAGRFGLFLYVCFGGKDGLHWRPRLAHGAVAAAVTRSLMTSPSV
jgi:hypothetical protein